MLQQMMMMMMMMRRFVKRVLNSPDGYERSNHIRSPV